MSVNARPASPQLEDEIQIDSDDRPMSQDAEPNARPDAEPNAKPDAKPDISLQKKVLKWRDELPYAEPDAEPNAKPDAEPDIRHSRSTSMTWISESEWTFYIKDDQGSKSSIFRVPKFLKNTKREAYVPQRVSLGLYHLARADLTMGRRKGRALRRMMERFLPADCDFAQRFLPADCDFADCARAEILTVEDEIRESYDGHINCDGETLARMLCIDGCFILEVLRSLCADLSKSMEKSGNKENEIIVFSSRDIVSDVLKLENQVPFIVLRKLLQFEPKSTLKVNEMLLNMVMGLLKPYYNTVHIKKWCHEKLAGKEEVQHLLGFLYEAIVHPSFGPIEDTDRGHVCSICIDCLGRCIRQNQEEVNEAPNQFPRIRPAVELRNAGIKFKPCHGGIEKIKFDRKNTTIFLPPICITDITEVLFRNLIAFEMCRPPQITYVSCYVNIMDNLINSQKDVALLRRMGVLTSWLGRDKEVVDLFNNLSKAAAPVNLFHAFDGLAERVDAYYEKGFRVRLQLPKLVQDYCSTPWKALASAAAIVLLVLTLLQTIFSGMAVHNGGTAVHK